MVSHTFCTFHFDKNFLISLLQPQLVPGCLIFCYVVQILSRGSLSVDVLQIWMWKKGMEYLIAFHNGPEISVIIYYQMWLLKALGVPAVLHEFQLRAVIESRIHLAGQSSRLRCACITPCTDRATTAANAKCTCHHGTCDHSTAHACVIGV